MLLRLKLQTDYTIYPAFSSKSCDQRCARRLRFIPARFAFRPFQPELFQWTLTDVNDGVSFGRIALQYPQGKADQQQLHLGNSARRLIQALSALYIVQMEHPNKREG